MIDPAQLFFERGRNFDEEVDCGGALVAPGLIDLQINGGFQVDFTYDVKDGATADRCLGVVGRGILEHGGRPNRKKVSKKEKSFF